MANFRNVSTYFWEDSKVDDYFTPEDKYFYLYLLTNPHTNLCGCYEIGKKQMERETGYTWETVIRLIGRMQDVHGVIQYNEQNREVLVLNWHKYNWTKSKKLLSAVGSVAKYIKTDEFREYVYEKIKEKDNEYEYEYETDSVSVSDVSVGYAYGKGTVSDKPMKPKKNAFHNFEERRYDNGKLEDALVNK